MKKEVLRRTPVVSPSHLEAIGTLKYGISVHCGVIVVWDEDYDERVLLMLEERFSVGTLKPLAVREHEGCIHLLWDNELDPLNRDDDFSVEDDYWCPVHYFRDGPEVKEFRHPYP